MTSTNKIMHESANLDLKSNKHFTNFKMLFFFLFRTQNELITLLKSFNEWIKMKAKLQIRTVKLVTLEGHVLLSSHFLFPL